MQSIHGDARSRRSSTSLRRGQYGNSSRTHSVAAGQVTQSGFSVWTRSVEDSPGVEDSSKIVAGRPVRIAWDSALMREAMPNRCLLFIAIVVAGQPAWSQESPDVDGLSKALSSSDVNERRDAAYALAALGANARDAVPALVKRLDDSDEQVWFQSVTALARIGPAASPTET